MKNNIKNKKSALSSTKEKRGERSAAIEIHKKSLVMNLILLVFSVGICFIAAAIGSLFTIANIPAWYATLAKPFFAPPNWLFGPAWTVLYFLMGVSLYLVLKKVNLRKILGRIAIELFALQLLLNVFWSILFFGLKSPFLGVLGIVALWFSIAGTIISFKRISRKAMYLLVPYILWVSFASALNAAVWVLNP
ncbi:MAG: tryptophan-rich sensory protein [Candidatus Diapherotrites archaeon]|nr:tryptophan-rich sensory protein [Candidatus Diapherotrites archaeon]